MLSHPQRVRIAKDIEKMSKYHLEASSPEEIDLAVDGGVNLNTLEAKKAADIINKLNNKKDKIKVIVDCPSVNTLAWKNKMISQ
jgi:NAD(P)H-hydrate repair Nnr-like enzyme with NAD(P)H-hydrate epimerase domain